MRHTRFMFQPLLMPECQPKDIQPRPGSLTKVMMA